MPNSSTLCSSGNPILRAISDGLVEALRADHPDWTILPTNWGINVYVYKPVRPRCDYDPIKLGSFRCSRAGLQVRDRHDGHFLLEYADPSLQEQLVGLLTG